jgi:hypothetical protein
LEGTGVGALAARREAVLRGSAQQIVQGELAPGIRQEFDTRAEGVEIAVHIDGLSRCGSQQRQE